MFKDIVSICIRNSKKEAITTQEARFSFGELLNLVERCADELEKVIPGPIVAFTLPSRLEAIVLMLACLKTGKTFMPIDTNIAESTKTEMLSIARCTALIEALDLDTNTISARKLNFSSNLNDIDLNGVMSIMFTSGSTGTPKGVMVPYSAVLNILKKPDFFLLDEHDVFATYSPLSFDASTFEIFTPLLNGNRLVILEKNEVLDTNLLDSAVKLQGITVLWMTAGLFKALVLGERISSLSNIKTLFVGGDKVDIEIARRFVEKAPSTALYNGYGPTENTVFSTVAALTKDVLQKNDKLVPIGCPIRGVQCVVQADDGKLLEGQTSGKLLLSGKGLAMGYIGLINNEAFIKHSEAVTGRFYDTGDDVYRDAENNYYFLGRRDKQIKLNGYRVNLSGLEQRCVQSGLAKQVYAYYSQLVNGLVLVCYAMDHRIYQDAQLPDFLKNVLNVWELPKRIFFIPDWPITSNGKTDYKALENRVEVMLSTSVMKISQDNILDKLISSLINKEIENRRLNLFDIGFDSLSITQLQTGIEKLFNISVDILELYTAGSVSGLEEMIRGKLQP